ncbi:general secretion pathway protein GspK [Sedimentisphaera salicampi]|uniref:ComEA protein n=1 Tax=Sedimentisphaera salicampi TaxID=1941349 RepID=A0A1W6LP60_9BACT|nr:helix-hairpin-helix domain-containing protein [Sedimentisphaera salicampi]ARN57547.1 comEA protein [Sedimentisphaera salicampi]
MPASFKIHSRRKGTVLIVTIWVTLLLAGLVIIMGRSLRVDALFAANSLSTVKCEAAAEGAIDYVLTSISSEEDSSVEYEQTAFEAMRIGDCYFWAISPDLSDEDHLSYGLIDEAGKVNLNTASYDMLTKLPGMTSELAYSIIDWRDGDQEVSPGGAESEYYLLLDEPYSAKDDDFETVEEVLLVKGAEKDILFGEDTNRNGLLDENENDGAASAPDDDGDGKLDPGFYNYVTVCSSQPNEASGGGEMINVNDQANSMKIFNLLKENEGEERAYEILAAIQTQQSYDNIIEFYYTSGMTLEEFEKLGANITTSDEDTINGLINVNSAPSEVLLCLPGLEESEVEDLVEYRAENPPEEGSIIWITEVLEEAKAVEIGSFITGSSHQYSADLVVAASDGRAFARYFIIIDTASGQSPQVIYRQSLKHLGWPLDAQILETLKSGKELE